jgi:leucyl aminopeptidase
MSRPSSSLDWAFPALETRASAGKVAADVVFVSQDSSKKPAVPAKHPYAAVIERLRGADGFSARVGATQVVRFGGVVEAENVIFVGLGQPAELTDEKVRQAAAALWSRLGAEKIPSAAVHLAELSRMSQIRALVEGIVLSCYGFNKYKKVADALHATRKLVFLAADRARQSHVQEELDRALAVGEAVNITRDWSNEPSNFGTPEYYAGEAQKLARRYGLKCRVISESEARREKMGLYLAVGQGSEREGKIVVLEYNPKSSDRAGKGGRKGRTLAFVGKGITFDSGGISIKPALKMEEMKHDMTGAATLLGATLLAARMGVPNRIVTILAFTENMPDGTAIQPGNVVRARNGKTVEIINTDAEGRLILADALDFAHDFKPDAIIDAATLTGAVQIALGKHCCAVLGNDDGLIQSLISAGQANHERMWQLPMWDEYFEDLKSDTADMKNSANDGSGGTIRGAIFMNQFIRKGMKWAHLDIAAVANAMGHVPYFPKKGASGMYVRTLAQFAAEF